MLPLAQAGFCMGGIGCSAEQHAAAAWVAWQNSCGRALHLHTLKGYCLPCCCDAAPTPLMLGQFMHVNAKSA